MKLPLILAGTLALTSGAASAESALWAAWVSDPVAADAYWIVAATQEDCEAQVAQSRGIDLIQPCHATAPSAITDPKEDKRTSKTPRPKDPDTCWGSGAGAAAGNGVGNAGSGMGGGG